MPDRKEQPARLLLVEDSAADAELIVRVLRTAGLVFDGRRIDTREEWAAALAEPWAWDLVLLDYHLPRLDTLDLLAELSERAPGTPAIVVSGSIDEESAVSVLRAGARDFVTKQRMARLAPAVMRELAAAADSRGHRAVLQSKELKFRAIFEGALDALLLADDDRVYVDANPAACDLLGVPLDRIVGRRIEDFSGDSALGVATVWAQFIAEGRQSGEFVLLRPDGERRTTEFSAAANVEPGVHLTILRDVSARRAQDQELMRSEERFRLAQEGARMGTWDSDLRSGAMTWSDGLRRLYGLPLDHPAALENFLSIVHPEDRARVRENVLTKERSGSHSEFECRIIRPDGEVRWLLSRSAPIHDADGILIRVLGVTVDTTEMAVARNALTESADKLRQAQKMEAVGQLAGGVAHDFNNLLTVINGYADVALGRCNGDRTMQHGLTEIRRAADRATELTHQLLAFSRRQVLKPEVLDLNEVVSEHASMLARLLGEDIRLNVALNARDAYVEADPGQLAQVVLNLAVNARDAMPNGGELVIRTLLHRQADADADRGLAPGRYVTLEVCDDGVGISSDDQAHLFEPFFTTKGVGEGTGLGLSTVHGIVEQSRGTIVVDSEVGRGTTFRIHLPQSDVPPTTYQPAAEPPTVSHETVLLVEDSDMVRGLAETILVQYGYEVIAAAGPLEAIAAAHGFPGTIALLVTDVVMPEMNGTELSEHLTRSRPSLATVYMSGYAPDAIIDRLDASARLHFLQKPFSASQLAAIAREALAGVAASA